MIFSRCSRSSRSIFLVRITYANLFICLSLPGFSISFVIWQICLPVLINHIVVGFPSMYWVEVNVSLGPISLSVFWNGNIISSKVNLSLVTLYRYFVRNGSPIIPSSIRGKGKVRNYVELVILLEHV